MIKIQTESEGQRWDMRSIWRLGLVQDRSHDSLGTRLVQPINNGYNRGDGYIPAITPWLMSLWVSFYDM